MLIDCHLHLFPDKLAPGTLEKLSGICKTVPCTDGTLSGTLAFLREGGIDLGVALHIATSPRSQQKVNAFAQEVQQQSGGKLISFGSVHPDAPDAITEVRRIADMGLHGIKFHADYQSFYFNDTRCYPIYEEIASLGLPITIHAGFDPFSPTELHASASAVAQVARDFPKLTIIAAHMGGLGNGYEGDDSILGMKNVWFDTAVVSNYYRGRQEAFAQHLRRHSVERVLFGTDCPWDTVKNTCAFLEQAGLSSEDLDRIYYKNAKNLFQL